MRFLSLLLGNHFLNIEPPWGDSTVSDFSFGCASGVDVAGRTSEDRDIGRDEPTGGISSSGECSDEARDSDCSSISI